MIADYLKYQIEDSQLFRMVNSILNFRIGALNVIGMCGAGLEQNLIVRC